MGAAASCEMVCCRVCQCQITVFSSRSCPRYSPTLWISAICCLTHPSLQTRPVAQVFYVDDVRTQQSALKDIFGQFIKVLSDVTHLMRRVLDTVASDHSKRGKLHMVVRTPTAAAHIGS
jgi:hypothetical protein